eukprot:scaffold1988_cov230-Chaetoceros_neogracile.AAC.4
MFKIFIVLTSFVITIGAFVPKNAFLNKNSVTRRRVDFFSSADRNNNGDDSYGFFGDEEVDRIARQKESFQFIFDIDEDSMPEDVFIILFNPDTEREGVHTIEFPKGSGNNMILAFESKQECGQFSESLKEQDFFDPGLKLKPPTETVLNLGLNPNLQQEMKMLDLLFQISANGQDGGSKDFDLIEEETSGDEGAWE